MPFKTVFEFDVSIKKLKNTIEFMNVRDYCLAVVSCVVSFRFLMSLYCVHVRVRMCVSGVRVSTVSVHTWSIIFLFLTHLFAAYTRFNGHIIHVYYIIHNVRETFFH